MDVYDKSTGNCFAGNEFVTVVSVGIGDDNSLYSDHINEGHRIADDISSGYVTVLTIGDDDQNETIEEVLVYRLPGERLGFGLKFEGGTKASEFVKRLFIQSCAPDSPASRVRSSWGSLTEGDEVIKIDSIPVNSLTRIDCVRCLKDSNVVIKLLVKHCDARLNSKSTEDLPLVIAAEKKRTPPPPPPVPPRKVPRKGCRETKCTNDGNTVQQSVAVAVLPVRQPLDSVIKTRLQSPRNSGRLLQPRQSPEVIKRVRRLSDSYIGPPDAEVYVDLFSQEPTYCLSESDDTGSSISTVVDRFASFPTTTTSSFAGSLPSTPTSVQKQMNFTNVPNPFDDDGEFVQDNNYLFSKLISLQENRLESMDDQPIEKNEKPMPLQPPVNFQDAPLSYGDEDVRIVEAAVKSAMESYGISNDSEIKNDSIITCEKRRPPPPPPRSKHHPTKEKNNNDYDAKNEYSENLPRLVDFVPKNLKIETFESVKKFLENERNHSSYPYKSELNEIEENGFIDNSMQPEENWTEDTEFYTFNWSPSSQLATIGEDEEECLELQRSPNSSTPIVIVEDADDNEIDAKDEPDGIEKSDVVASSPPSKPATLATPTVTSITGSGVQEVMEVPSINSRQPPDGHEFPDFHEAVIMSKPTPSSSSTVPVNEPIKLLPRTYNHHVKENNTTSVRNMIAMFSKPSTDDSRLPNENSNDFCKTELSKSVMNINANQCSFHNYNFTSTSTNYSANRNALDLDLTNHALPTAKLANDTSPPRLHMRSQSLIDISNRESKPVADRWSLLVEQRRKGLSKLKGLIIPEHADPDENIPVIDLPEIKSTATPILPPTTTLNFQIPNHNRNSSTPNLSTFSNPIWNTDNSKSIPTYSPAFKRKTLQVYGRDKMEGDKTDTTTSKLNVPVKQVLTSQVDDECQLPAVQLHTSNDAPKSLESITSPTRSDCSFEYSSCSPELTKLHTTSKSKQQLCRLSNRHKEDPGKSEDESDNDSAVSSSQSSYISRNSPPASPTHLQTHFSSSNILENDPGYDATDSLNRRLLKPKSVEAINRKNILASAKCRSGRDLKVGSPLIQRKFLENGEEQKDQPEEEQVLETSVQEDLVTISEDAIKSDEKSKEILLEEPLKEIQSNSKTTTTPVSNDINGIPGDTKKKSKEPVIVSAIKVRASVDPVRTVPKYVSNNNRKSSVTDLKKNFEKPSETSRPLQNTKDSTTTTTTTTVSKVKSRLSQNFNAPVQPVAAKRNSFSQPAINITSNTDVTNIVDATLKDLNETINKADLKIVLLRPEISGGSVGITLAGGTDYETKEITVHRVRNESVAFHSGRIKKGDRILSINGKSMKGLTHAESIAILKEPVAEVIIVACAGKDIPTPVLTPSSRHSNESSINETKDLSMAPTTTTSSTKQDFIVVLTKDAGGLGFSMEGGKDSLQGDVPLVIKKLFTGGTADKCGKLVVGDELIEINGGDVTSMSRIDAWTFMKKLPTGEIILKVRR